MPMKIEQSRVKNSKSVVGVKRRLDQWELTIVGGAKRSRSRQA